MKRILINLAFGCLFLVGFGILSYPTISDQWNTYRQSRLISTYEAAVAEMEPEDYSREWEAAWEFNNTLVCVSVSLCVCCVYVPMCVCCMY